MQMQETLSYELVFAGKDLSPNTKRAYLSDLKNFEKYLSGHKAVVSNETPDKNLPFATSGKVDLGSVGPLEIAEYKRYLMKKGLRPASINRALRALSAYYKAVGADNPACGIKLLREAKPAPASLCRKKQLALMRAVSATGKTREITIVTLILHTGLRVSELCALNVSDILTKDRSGRLRVRYGKGDKARDLPLNATARGALCRWIEERGEKPGPLFPSNRNASEPISTRAVEYLFERCARAGRVEGVTPHTLRHTFCKSLVDAGVSLDQVALLAGHKSLRTTMRYTLANFNDLERAVEGIAWE
jgi:integrase/recombinase XerC